MSVQEKYDGWVPMVGDVVAEVDSRNPEGYGYKRIADVSADGRKVVCRAGLNGTGRKSTVAVRRLYTSRYRLVRAVDGA